MVDNTQASMPKPTPTTGDTAVVESSKQNAVKVGTRAARPARPVTRADALYLAYGAAASDDGIYAAILGASPKDVAELKKHVNMNSPGAAQFNPKSYGGELKLDVDAYVAKHKTGNRDWPS